MLKPALLTINFMFLEIQLYSKFKTYLMFLRLFLGGFANSVHVSEEANDRFNSELKPELCNSLTFALNNVSRHNDTIPGGRTCQVMYRCEHTIVIKHSLTITKFPKSSITPATTDRFKETNYLKNFFWFHKLVLISLKFLSWTLMLPILM